MLSAHEKKQLYCKSRQEAPLREQHSASVMLVGVLYDISLEKIC